MRSRRLLIQPQELEAPSPLRALALHGKSATFSPMSSLKRRSLKVFPAGSNGELNFPPQLAIALSRARHVAIHRELKR